jgi:hypothetical protein
VNATDAIIAAPSQLENPIRAEVFGIERLEEHAESLAAAQRTTEGPAKGRNLLPRVRKNGHLLLAAYRNILEAVREKSEITPAEEWLLDNFHVADEQLREIPDHLPRSYYRLLPKIAEGHLEGYPRVYSLAWAYVAHTDSRFEPETLQRFVDAYQRIQPLTIGELWAVAIHLRVALVENLRRLSEQIIGARQARAKADELADRLLGLSGRPVEQADDVLSRLGDVPLAGAFAVQLLQRLRDQDPSIMPALDWLNKKLSGQGTSPNEVVAQEHQAQGAANVTVRNIITSMRWMSSIDWEELPLPGSQPWTSRRGTNTGPRSSCSPGVQGDRRSRWHGKLCSWPGTQGGKRGKWLTPDWGFPGFPSVPRRTQVTISFPEAGGLSRNVWVFASPGEFSFTVPIEYTGRPSSWQRLLPSPPSCSPPGFSSLGPLGQTSGSSSCWESSALCPSRIWRCPSSIAWWRFSFHPRCFPSSTSPWACLRSFEP